MQSLASSCPGKATGKVCLAHSDKHCSSLPISRTQRASLPTLSSVFSRTPNRALKLIISSKCNLKSGLEGKRKITDSLKRLPINLMTSVDGKKTVRAGPRRECECSVPWLLFTNFKLEHARIGYQVSEEETVFRTVTLSHQ